MVTDIIAQAFVDFIRRVCECENLWKAHAKDLELAKVGDEVTKAISEGIEGEYGPVTVKVRKKLLGRREVRVWLYGNEIDVDALLAEISKARSRAAWLLNDCSENALLETLYKYEDRYLIEVAQRNLDKVKNICAGELPRIEFGEAPAHVVEGVVKGVRIYLSGHGTSA